MKKKLLSNLIFLMIVVLTFYLGLNIYLTQSISPIFFNLTSREDEKSAIDFLKKIKNSTEFTPQLSYFKEKYDSNLESEVFEAESERKIEIKKLEKIIEKNKDARDILLNLAILYYEDNNFSKAKSFYRQAVEIDPEIKIDKLESLR